MHRLIAVLVTWVIGIGSAFSSDSSTSPQAGRTPSAWDQYILYTLNSSFLLNMGFTRQAMCAVTMMKSVNLRAADPTNLSASRQAYLERVEVFDQVVQDGLALMERSPANDTLTETQRRETVYTAMLQSSAELSSYLLLQNFSEGEPSATLGVYSWEDYRVLYNTLSCSQVIGYEFSD